MATKQKTSASKTKQPDTRYEPRYINPHVSIGFYKLFGTEANVDIMQELLPVLLGKDSRILSLHYLNPEQLGRSKEDRSAVYDIYCETDRGEKFIVEIQSMYQEFYMDKSVYYSTFPIREQVENGVKWNFELNGVYTVGILNFEFEDDDTNIKDDKLTHIYLELPKFTKTEDELETLLDKWMYVFKHLSLLAERPKALKERVFKRLFRIAEIEQLNYEEQIAYRNSQMHYWDYMNTIKTAQKVMAEKVAKEMDDMIREKEAAIQKKEDMIREKEVAIQEKDTIIHTFVENLYKQGVPPEQFAEASKIPIDRVNEILKSL
jgi:predicted transposase/invertase (TIGR01784 family)